jgi:chorismate mutase
MPLTSLIDLSQNIGELVMRALVQTILTESAAQMVLAGAEAEKYRIRAFAHKNDVLTFFQSAPQPGTEEASPVVVVRWMSEVNSRSAAHGQQNLISTFWLDCYGYGIAAVTEDGDIIPDDRAAGEEAVRCAYLVKQFLFADPNYDLGLPGIVFQRKLVSEMDPILTATQHEMDESLHVRCRRVIVEVNYSQDFEAVEHVVLAGINVELRKETVDGFLYARFEVPPSA